MLGRALVRPLEQDWRAQLDAVAGRRGWPASGDVARLAARVVELSAAYNAPHVARATVRDAGAARLGFVFARDVPKGAAAVRELVAVGALGLGAAALRVLDLGAGLGAMTWGLVRALEAAGQAGAVEATWIDVDPDALAVGVDLVRERAKSGQQTAIDLRVTPLARSVTVAGALGGLGLHDVVLAGNVLSEMDVGHAAEARVDRHVTLLGNLLDHHLAPDGTLVLVEPALRDRSRHLHHIRDRLRARGVTVFAPCLHPDPCPALARESDWCHEDLDVDLPPWLVPVARAAGLRREGLTFSYLVLRNDGRTLAGGLGAPHGSAALRVVSELMRSKGKRDAFVCGTMGGCGARVKATRLDRDARDSNAAWPRARRGDVLVLDPAPAPDRPRIGAESRVVVSDGGESR